MRDIAWIAADWGTTNLRVWGMTQSGTVVQTAHSDKGMGSLTQDAFEPALLDLIGEWIDAKTTVMACGMVGSRQGWVEAGYAKTPCPVIADNFARASTHDPRLDVHIIPGISQTSPADVMRGEETQIAGFLALNPNWDGVLCLPGSHTKWVHVSANEVISFQTLMTGELYAAISGHTVLRHSIGAGWNEDSFVAGVQDGMSRPERIAAHLFSLRAEGLLNDQCPDAARARLSGLLVGGELAATKPYWLGQNVAIVGEGQLASYYAQALELQGVRATRAAADRITLAGLTVAYAALKE